MNYQTDICILGAGLAGLSLADAFAEHNLSTIVIDKNSIASGASGTPGGLVNPATGRRAKKSWKAEQCYEAVSANLEKIQQHSNVRFFFKNGLLRPALLQKMARKMKKQYDKTTWPDGWCQWKNEAEIKEIHPGINCVKGGLWLPIGLTVDVEKYMKAYAGFLKKRGVSILFNQEPRKIHQTTNWQMELENDTVCADHLIFAIGHGVVESSYWDWLPVNLIKGQVAKFKLPENSLSFSHSISSLGYIARLDENDTFVQGSTYEHDFEHLNPDAGGLEYLRKRMHRTLPQLEKQVTVAGQWAGVRTSTPNYKPILGRHPKYKNLHVFTGLGSKGLLYGKFLADHYADHFVNGTELYPEIDIARCE